MDNKEKSWGKRPSGLLIPVERAFLEARSATERANCRDGVLTIVQYPADDDGNPIYEKMEVLLGPCYNLIVSTGREALRKLQAHSAEGGTAAGLFDLGYLAVGNGSSSGATVPLPGNTALLAELTSVAGAVPRPQLNVTAPPPGPPFTVNLWTAQIGTGQLNGENINEMGMFCLNQTTLFNHRTFANQAKSSGFVMEFRTTVIF